jgi:hypothetical protein
VLDEDLLTFIQGSIRSVWALEVLLRLRREPERAWETAALAQELRATDRLVGDVLDSCKPPAWSPATARAATAPPPRRWTRSARAWRRPYRERPAAVTKAVMSAP